MQNMDKKDAENLFAAIDFLLICIGLIGLIICAFSATSSPDPKPWLYRSACFLLILVGRWLIRAN